MIDGILNLLKVLPKEAITLILATLPITELRGAIPWALASLPVGGGLSWPVAYLFAVVGNFIPVIPLLLLWGPLSRRLCRYKLFDRFFTWLFERTRKRGRVVERYEALGLIIFVGIPLPMTGAWTGTIAAFIFGVPFHRAVVCIALGILLAGVVVTLASLGVIGLAGLL